MVAGDSEMAVDSRGLVYNPRKEYVENGRFYHAWHKGKYMFPCDEVRTVPCHSFSLPANTRTGGEREA